MSAPAKKLFRVDQQIRLTRAGAVALGIPEAAGEPGKVFGFSPACPRCVYVQMDDSPAGRIIRVFAKHIEAIP